MFNRKTKYSVCSDCGIHFEPVTGEINQMFADKCGIHRKPLFEIEMKKRAVANWARDNWQTLYPKFEKDRAKKAADMQKAYAANGAGMRGASCGCHSCQQRVGGFFGNYYYP